MEFQIFLVICFISSINAFISIELTNANPALDYELYNKVLDAEKCQEQIEVLQDNLLLSMRFADAGLRIPRGFTEGNFMDWGNYHQCLDIRHDTENEQIQGKYCMIQVPVNQNLTVPWNVKWSGFDPTALVVDEGTALKVQEFNAQRAGILKAMGMENSRSLPSTINFSTDLAICIPKPCTTEQAINSIFFNLTLIGFQYTDQFCRLPNDKPWSPADTVATVIFSVIGILTVLSTGYDFFNIYFLKNDSKQLNPFYTSFSVYTNGRRLMTFSSAPGILHCLDGIRTLAMAWVVIGHSFTTENALANPLESLNWMTSVESVWITSAAITVDTFFCLAGLVLVYTIAGKMTGVQLIKNLPLFYLNRLLRLMPILAVAVLLQASYFNRMLDGPVWFNVEDQTNWCRRSWWLTLLHVQNFINSDQMCFTHSWYVAIDVHCYLLSPLVLFWVLGRSRKAAWIALTAGLLVAITGASVYSFIGSFPSGIVQPGRGDELADYITDYYVNTLTRASPFFVGMIAGYVLHLLRGKKLELSWVTVAILWVCAATVSTTIFFYSSFISDMEWDNPFVDNLMNSIMRPAWSAAVCWMIVACVHGYAGPINWFLCLNIWKLPARLSYALFVLHYPIMYAINATALAPIYFTPARFTFKFLAHATLSVVVAYFATLLIDAPFTTITKQLLDPKKRKPSDSIAKKDELEDHVEKDTVNINNGDGEHNEQSNENNGLHQRKSVHENTN